MKNQTPLKVTFDGFGLNDANNEYKERIATLSRHGYSLLAGERMETAINCHDNLLAFARDVYIWLSFPDLSPAVIAEIREKAKEVINQAEPK